MPLQVDEPTAEIQNDDTKNGESSVNGVELPTEPKLPAWLNSQLFEQLLKDTIKEFKEIRKFAAKPALAAGENYATVMLGIEIELALNDGSTLLQSYMLKVPHESRQFETMLKHNIFDKESGVYCEVVPEFEQMYRDVGVDIRFGANCFQLQLPEKQDYILLEDLRLRGFRNVKRQDCLDQQHAETVLEKLAQWHAASATRVARKGYYDAKYHDSHFDETQKEVFKQFGKKMSTSFMQSAQTLEGFKTYGDDLVQMQDNLFDAMFETLQLDESDFNVLNHGDCWSNNIMFRYNDENELQETYLVDYQMVSWGSPIVDLYYFLLSSTQRDIKVSKFDYFIRYYYDHLSKHLKLLNYPKTIPTLQQLHIKLLKSSLWAYTAVTGIMSAVLVDPSEHAKIENFFEESSEAVDFQALMFNNDRYRSHLEVVLPWLHNRGALKS